MLRDVAGDPYQRAISHFNHWNDIDSSVVQVGLAGPRSCLSGRPRWRVVTSLAGRHNGAEGG